MADCQGQGEVAGTEYLTRVLRLETLMLEISAVDWRYARYRSLWGWPDGVKRQLFSRRKKLQLRC